MALPNPFQKLQELYFPGRVDTILEELKPEFRTFADAYFTANRTPGNHNTFFEQFTPIWLDLLQRRRYFEGIHVWNYALGLALEWEKRNKPNKIHKGTPYYFLGVTGILNNELENGFLAMHQALKEDKRLSGRRIPAAPAFWFVTLDATNQNQFFKPKVEQIANYLSDKLGEYATSRGGSLTFQQFCRKLLRKMALNEEVFLFVYALFRLRKILLETNEVYKKNVFSSLLHAKILFDLSLITEKVIEYKNPLRGNMLLFSNEMLFMSQLTTGTLSFDRAKIRTLRNSFHDSFAGTLNDLLANRYTGIVLSDIEKDFAIAYGVRNFAAHRVQNQPVLYNKMKKLSQSILNTLFYSIEHLY